VQGILGDFWQQMGSKGLCLSGDAVHQLQVQFQGGWIGKSGLWEGTVFCLPVFKAEQV